MKSLIIASILSTSMLFADGGGTGFDMMQFIPLVLIFVIFYFLIMRPQQKKARVHQEMLKELRRGDRVVTAGGLLGTVDKVVNDGEISLEIADNVKVRVVKATVTEVMTKTQPVTENTKHAAVNKDNAPKITLSDPNPVKKATPSKAKPAAKPAAKKPTKPIRKSK